LSAVKVIAQIKRNGAAKVVGVAGGSAKEMNGIVLCILSIVVLVARIDDCDLKVFRNR
jgi:hypothetical protein